MIWKKKNAVETGLAEIYPRLWRYALTLTQNKSRADDLANTACVRALEKASLFQSGTALDRWVFTLARRVWLNEIRADSIRQGAGFVDLEKAALVDNSCTAETNFFLGEVLSNVMALPEAQRETVLLVYVEEFTYRDAAEILDIPIGTVMSRLAAARKRLNQTMQNETPARMRDV